MRRFQIIAASTALILLSACGSKVTPNAGYQQMPQQFGGQNAFSQPGMSNPMNPQMGGQQMGGQMGNQMNNQMGNSLNAMNQGQAPNAYANPGAPAQTRPAQAPIPGLRIPTGQLARNGRQVVSLNAGAPQAGAPASQARAPQSRAPQGPATPATAPQAPAPQAKKAPAAPKADPFQEYLGKARQAFQQMQGMRATIATFEKADGKGNAKINYLYSQGKVKIDVISSDDASRNGVKLSYNKGGNEVRARASGMLSVIAVTLPMSDKKVISGRGYQLNQIDLNSVIPRLTAPGQTGKVLGKTQFAGANVVVLEIQPKNHFDPRITKERLGVDMNTGMVRIHEMYQGNELVFAGRVESLQLNPQVGPKDFEV